MAPRYQKQYVHLTLSFVRFILNEKFNSGCHCTSRISSWWDILCALGTSQGSRHTPNANFLILWGCVSKASYWWLSEPGKNQFLGAFTAPSAIFLEGRPQKYFDFSFIESFFSFRLLVPYRNTFPTQESLSNSTFYLSLMQSHFSSNGLPCTGKNRPKTISCQSSGMHFTKV